MNKPLFLLLSLCLSTLVVHSSYASSSISTRVKVVEDKVRVHDKKIKDIKAQQEALSRSMHSSHAPSSAHEPNRSAMKQTVAAQPSAKPQVKEKTEAQLQQERAHAAARAKEQAEAQAKAKHERLAAMYRARYAYP